MAQYTFNCEDCKKTTEIYSSISEYKSLSECPHCNSPKIYRNYQVDLPVGTVVKGDTEITVGQLADRNRDRFSEDKKLALYHKHNSYLWAGDDVTMPKGQPPEKLPKPRKVRAPKIRKVKQKKN